MSYFKDLALLISINANKSLNFGSKDDAPSPDWVECAERSLGCKFPPSYLWFLNNYGGGEVYGNEIFSIYQHPFDGTGSGDVVAMTLQDRLNGFILSTDVSVCCTDFGEIFVLDSISANNDGEFPVIKIEGKKRDLYANNFGEFLLRFISDIFL